MGGGGAKAEGSEAAGFASHSARRRALTTRVSSCAAHLREEDAARGRRRQPGTETQASRWVVHLSASLAQASWAERQQPMQHITCMQAACEDGDARTSALVTGAIEWMSLAVHLELLDLQASEQQRSGIQCMCTSGWELEHAVRISGM